MFSCQPCRVDKNDPSIYHMSLWMPLVICHSQGRTGQNITDLYLQSWVSTTHACRKLTFQLSGEMLHKRISWVVACCTPRMGISILPGQLERLHKDDNPLGPWKTGKYFDKGRRLGRSKQRKKSQTRSECSDPGMGTRCSLVWSDIGHLEQGGDTWVWIWRTWRDILFCISSETLQSHRSQERRCD